MVWDMHLLVLADIEGKLRAAIGDWELRIARAVWRRSCVRNIVVLLCFLSEERLIFFFASNDKFS